MFASNLFTALRRHQWKFLHLVALITLFTSIYFLRYSQEYNLRQKECRETEVMRDVWITQPPLVDTYGYRVETGEFSLLFSQQSHLKLGNHLRVIGTPREFSQCIKTDKLVLIVRSFDTIKEHSISPFSLMSKKGALLTVAIGKYLQQSEVSLRRFLPIQHAQIAAGMILGRKLPTQSQVNTDLRAAGVTHILVASGANLVLIISFLHAVMRKLFSRRMTEYISAIEIMLYTTVVGFQAPIIRAAVFFILLYLASWTGRKVRAAYALLLTVVFMLIFQPFLISSVSLWLSVTASFALLFSSLIPESGEIDKKIPFLGYIRETCLSSLLVFLFTAPLLIFTFESLNLRVFLSNVAVLWLVGPISVYGVGVVFLLPLIPTFLQALFLLPLWLCLEVFIRLINLILKLPAIEISIQSPSLIGMLLCYGALIALYCLILAKKIGER